MQYKNNQNKGQFATNNRLPRKHPHYEKPGPDERTNTRTERYKAPEVQDAVQDGKASAQGQTQTNGTNKPRPLTNAKSASEAKRRLENAQVKQANASMHQAMYMGNSREPSIQERARARQLEKERQKEIQYGEYDDEYRETAPSAPRKRIVPKNVDTSKSKLQKPNVKEQTAETVSALFPKDKSAQGAPDFLALEIAVALLVIGLVMVFSASSYRSLLEYGSAFSYFIRQGASAILGLGLMVVATYISPEIIRKLAPIALLAVAALVVVTIFKGEETLGATRWITIAGIRFTPSEMAKPLMIVCTADLIKNSPYDVVKSRENLFVFVLMLLTLVVIATEDLGSALAIFGGCFAMFIIAGIGVRAIAGVFAACLLGVVAACIQEPYRINRIIGFLSQTDADASTGSAYQLVQSLYAFGSGGLFGVGIGNSGQKLLYLPGMHTDFIYSVIGEDLGIIGALLVLGLFLAFAWRGFWIATRIEDNFKSYLAFGAAAIIVVQALINMGVAVGVLPVTGITLPFISYGGTSLMITLGIVGILLNMSRYANKEKKKESAAKRAAKK